MPDLNKIVLIDDEADIRNIASLVLSQVGGYTVEAAENGLDGLAKVRAMEPDLVLLDVMMPSLDGPATLAMIQKGFPELSVAFLTAQTDADSVAHLKSLGAVGVIEKPFDPMALSQTVQELWDSL